MNWHAFDAIALGERFPSGLYHKIMEFTNPKLKRQANLGSMVLKIPRGNALFDRFVKQFLIFVSQADVIA